MSTEPQSPTPPEEPPTWEDRLPQAQKSFNRFCENWIFAFIVAMAIRHYVVEPFRIPSTSMEPTLYGEPALTRSDFVIVDKLLWRFREVQRYDITVFQFPHPEVSGPQGTIQPAVLVTGERVDHAVTRPPVYRNFVKRAVVLPGERFYIAGGDLFIAGADGAFAVARKPADVQEELWEPIYRHGVQREPEWYVPWVASTGSAVENRQDAGLTFTLGGEAGAIGEVAFTQPFRNLYLKPGPVHVEKKIEHKADGILIPEASLEHPLFPYRGEIGSVWDLDTWWVSRATVADLDNKSHGALLNTVMREWVDDVEVSFTAEAIAGEIACVLAEGDRQALVLALTTDAWRLILQAKDAADRVLAEGSGVVGRAIRFANLDDQVILSIDGSEVHRSDIATVDPNLQRLRLSWRGRGSIALTTIALRRDLFYCESGFLLAESVPVATPSGPGDLGTKRTMREFDQIKGQLASTLALQQNGKEVFHLRDTRAQILGHDPSPSELLRRYGYSPETAITVPDNAYVLMGDNSCFSWDSRNWGFVPASNLRGRVVVRIRARKVFGTAIPFLDWSLVQ